MKAYTAWVHEFVAGAQHADLPGRAPGWDTMTAESREDQLLDYIMLRLRLADGIPLDDLQRKYGLRVRQTVERTLGVNGQKYAYATEVNGLKHLRLSDPEGFLMSNDCISDVFAQLMPEHNNELLAVGHV